jgi:hypothetical protein
MILGNYQTSTRGVLVISDTDDVTPCVSDKLVYETYIPMPNSPVPDKYVLTKKDKRQMFKIANQKHSRRLGK